jgi:hypothetical protein
MSRRPLALAMAGAAMLAGCGALNPYPTVPRAPQLGQPSGARVAICYNGLATALAAVQAEAQQECPAGTVAEPVDTDFYMQNCPVLLPARATFACLPKQ